LGTAGEGGQKAADRPQHRRHWSIKHCRSLQWVELRILLAQSQLLDIRCHPPSLCRHLQERAVAPRCPVDAARSLAILRLLAMSSRGFFLGCCMYTFESSTSTGRWRPTNIGSIVRKASDVLVANQLVARAPPIGVSVWAQMLLPRRGHPSSRAMSMMTGCG